ncbi:MAG: TlpA family protein disulfide reductase [Acidimicrobiia bacterium]
MPVRRAVLALLFVAAACGGSSDSQSLTTSPPATATAAGSAEAFAVIASSDMAVGRERLLLALAGPGNQRLGGPDVAVSVEVFPADVPGAVQEIDADWIWAVPGVSGLYRGSLEFDRAGTWVARVTAEGAVLTEVPFDVKEAPFTVAVGSPAPRSVTPIAAEVAALAEITTDPEPDPAFYALSVADAVGDGKPTVVIFSTPAFCQTAICGPTLDVVKSAAAGLEDVDFIHVEVYEGMTEPGFVPDPAHLSPAVIEWGLPSEPWVFVIDASGKVAARFEGVVAAEELLAALS